MKSAVKVKFFVILVFWGCALAILTRDPENPQNLITQFLSLPLAVNKKIDPQVTMENGLRLPVLMYHYVRELSQPEADPLGYSLSVTPSAFEEQLRYLVKEGYQGITPVELYQALNKRMRLPDKPALLTFDDGYLDFYTTAYPLLQKYNLKATVFVVSGFVSNEDNRYLSWEELKRLDQSGLVTIGAHTLSHKNLVTSQDAEKQVQKSKEDLEKFLNHPVISFAYPGGTFNSYSIETVREAGYDLAFTTRFGIWHDFDNRFALDRVRISGGMDLEKFAKRLNGQRD